MKKYFLFTFLIVAWAMVSCSNDDSPDIDESVPFYQNLGVAYDVTNNTTRVGANFNKQDSSGVNIKLNGPASILINNITPNFANVGVYFYTYSFSGLDGVKFVFTRSEDKTFTNVASINDIRPIAIPESFNALSKSGTTTLTWEGDPVGANELVEAHITYTGGAVSIFNRTQGSKSIDLSFTNPITAPTATLSLSRAKTHPLQQSNGSAGGQLNVSYIRSKEVNLE